jgi:hypothetical protein
MAYRWSAPLPLVYPWRLSRIEIVCRWLRALGRAMMSLRLRCAATAWSARIFVRLVVAIVDNESATLKRFYKESSRARLEPANEDFDPIYSDNCRIESIVVGLVRRL